MLNNPRIYQGVLDTVGIGMSPCIVVSRRYNVIYGTEDFHSSMAGACAHGRQVAGCARSSKRIGSADGDLRPSDEWMRDVASRDAWQRRLQMLCRDGVPADWPAARDETTQERPGD